MTPAAAFIAVDFLIVDDVVLDAMDPPESRDAQEVALRCASPALRAHRHLSSGRATQGARFQTTSTISAPIAGVRFTHLIWSPPKLR